MAEGHTMRAVRGPIRRCRPLTTKETDVLAVAAELVRAKWDDDVPDHLADRMVSWAMRLRAAHDELLASLAVPDA